MADAAIATGGDATAVEAALRQNSSTSSYCNKSYQSLCGEDVRADAEASLCAAHYNQLLADPTLNPRVIELGYPRHEASSDRGRKISTCRYDLRRFCRQFDGHVGCCSGEASPFR